jgi:hypothetical protein
MMNTRMLRAHRATSRRDTYSSVTLLPATAPIAGKRALTAFLERVTSSTEMRSFTLECFGLHVSGDWASEWCTERQVVDLADESNSTVAETCCSSAPRSGWSVAHSK